MAMASVGSYGVTSAVVQWDWASRLQASLCLRVRQLHMMEGVEGGIGGFGPSGKHLRWHIVVVASKPLKRNIGNSPETLWRL
jgi:hypothetical protein